MKRPTTTTTTTGRQLEVLHPLLDSSHRPLRPVRLTHLVRPHENNPKDVSTRREQSTTRQPRSPCPRPRPRRRCSPRCDTHVRGDADDKHVVLSKFRYASPVPYRRSGPNHRQIGEVSQHVAARLLAARETASDLPWRKPFRVTVRVRGKAISGFAARVVSSAEVSRSARNHESELLSPRCSPNNHAARRRCGDRR